MVLRKKAQFFTLGAIMVIILMFTTFEVYSILHQRAAVRERVSSMDAFLKSLETNLGRQLQISGSRGIIAANDQITVTRAFIPNVDDFFEELFFNGTIGGVPYTDAEGTKYEDIINNINMRARKINTNITLNNTNYSITQTDPWNIRVTMVSDFVMQDVSGLARWEKTQNISVLYPIEGFFDPLYTVKTNGAILRQIAKTPNPPPSRATFIEDFRTNKRYSNNTDAPSFLMRLEGNFSASPYGIESFVKKEDIAREAEGHNAGTLPVYSLTDPSFIAEISADHIFFDGNLDPGSSSVPVPGGQYFKIDCNHDAIYDLSINCP